MTDTTWLHSCPGNMAGLSTKVYPEGTAHVCPRVSVPYQFLVECYVHGKHSVPASRPEFTALRSWKELYNFHSFNKPCINVLARFSHYA